MQELVQRYPNEKVYLHGWGMAVGKLTGYCASKAADFGESIEEQSLELVDGYLKAHERALNVGLNPR